MIYLNYLIDPPVVNVMKMSLSDKIRDIQCIAHGEPKNFTFFMWEHRSLLNEHIRHLNSTEDGILQLPPINTSHRYQDTGFYTCNVSNGIPDYAGNMFQQGTGYLDSKGIYEVSLYYIFINNVIVRDWFNEKSLSFHALLIEQLHCY